MNHFFCMSTCVLIYVMHVLCPESNDRESYCWHKSNIFVLIYVIPESNDRESYCGHKSNIFVLIYVMHVQYPESNNSDQHERDFSTSECLGSHLLC